MLSYLCVVKTFHAHTLDGHSAAVYGAYFDAENSVLYTGGADGMVGAWNTSDHSPHPFSVRVGETVFSVLPVVSRQRMYIGRGDGGMHVIDMAEKSEIRHLKYHEGPVFAILDDAERNCLYTAGSDGALAVIDGEDYRLLLKIPVVEDKLRTLCLSPDGKMLLVGASDGRIRIFDTGYFNELEMFDAHVGGVYCMRFLRDGNLMTGGRDGHLRLWNFSGAKPRLVEAVPAHNYAIYSIDLHPELPYVVSGSRDRKVKIWPLYDWKNAARIERRGTVGHTHSVNAVGWSGSDEVFSIGDDRKLHFWKVVFPSVSQEALP